MRTEEEKLAGLQHKLGELVHLENAIIAAQLKSEMGILGLPSIEGSDLQALAAFQARIHVERAKLRVQRTQCEAEIAKQRNRLVKARKDFRVLEKLKEKRWRTWVYLSDREVEHTAAESYISKWVRSQDEGGLL
jgi:flagellar biosynthesis chaperone FliJ